MKIIMFFQEQYVYEDLSPASRRGVMSAAAKKTRVSASKQLEPPAVQMHREALLQIASDATVDDLLAMGLGQRDNVRACTTACRAAMHLLRCRPSLLGAALGQGRCSEICAALVSSNVKPMREPLRESLLNILNLTLGAVKGEGGEGGIEVRGGALSDGFGGAVGVALAEREQEGGSQRTLFGDAVPAAVLEARDRFAESATLLPVLLELISGETNRLPGGGISGGSSSSLSSKRGGGGGLGGSAASINEGGAGTADGPGSRGRRIARSTTMRAKASLALSLLFVHRPALLHSCCERKATKFSSVVARLAQCTPAELAHATAASSTASLSARSPPRGGSSGSSARVDERAKLRQQRSAKRRKLILGAGKYFHRTLQHLAGTMGVIAVRLVGDFYAAANASPPEDQMRLVPVCFNIVVVVL